jgi:DNA-binding transcriptional MerR regulator
MKKDRTQLPIGEVARSFGVSDNTIRRLEAAGLMTPARVNELTGYRYYDIDNIAAISNIMNLKDFGFTYAEIHEGLREKDGMQKLYDKLEAKRNSIDLMLTKLGRRLPQPGVMLIEITETPDTICFVMSDRIVPSPRAMAGLVRRAVFEAVSRSCPINHSLPVLMTCEVEDLRDAVSKRALKISACVPLRKEVDDPDIAVVPGVKAASFTFDRDFGPVEEAVGKIESEMTARGFRQNGPIRAILDATDKRSESRAPAGSKIHILLPIE